MISPFKTQLKKEESWKSRNLKYLPNTLTFIRIILTPVCVYFLVFNSKPILAFLIFVIASITDAFDGYYARKFNVISRLGAFLDPLADKIMVVSIFLCFFYLYNNVVDIYVLSMIIFRDVFVTIIRMIMEYKNHTMVTSKISKLKTVFQIVAINVMFLAIIFGGDSFLSNQSQYLFILMISTAFITFYTGVHYFICNYNKLRLIFRFDVKS